MFAASPNPVFLETGALFGDGIQAALDAGFRRVISIEIQPKYQQHCIARFADVPGVTVMLGDSATMLGAAIRDVREPITFWLDGHYSGGDTGFGLKGAPLLEELRQIGRIRSRFSTQSSSTTGAC